MSVNFSLKLVSLLLAILLELYFYSPDNALTITLPASIVVRGVPPSMVFLYPRHAERGIPARISVRGPRPLIERIRSVPQQFTADYPADEPLVFPVNIDRKQLWLPAGVELVEVEPENITVELDRVITKSVPIDLDIGGFVAAGAFLEQSVVEPTTVSITGPSRDVERIASIRTEHVDVTDLREEQRVSVRLLLPNNLIRAQTDIATVTLVVKAIPAERVFDRVSVKLQAPDGFAGTVEPTKVKATVVGPKELLDGLQQSLVELRVNTAGLGEGRHEVTPVANLPQGITLYSTEPKKVVVTLVQQAQSH